MKDLSTKVDKNEVRERITAKRMDDRLNTLEDEMRRFRENQVRRMEREQTEKDGENSKRTEEYGEDLSRNQEEQMENLEKNEEELSEAGQAGKDLEKLFRKQNKRYERIRIEEKELAKDKDAEIETVEQTPYRSTWARGISQEKQEIQEETLPPGRIPKNTGNGVQNESWTNLGIKTTKTPKKTRTLQNWFGAAPGTSDSSGSSQEEDESVEWTQVQREKQNKRKQILRKQRQKDKKQELCTKMQYMVGVGPIEDASIKFFEDKTGDSSTARKEAVKEFLGHYLSFDKNELECLEIIDTKRAAKDKVIYCAFNDQNDVREVHFRKAISENQDIIVRDYIPPQMYSRYMTLAKKATEKRAHDRSLKTQLRWREKDIEVYLKNKVGMEDMDPLETKTVNKWTRVDLQEFMQDANLPEIDLSIKWRARPEGKPRKNIVIGKPRSALPSLRKNNAEKNKTGIVRQHSQNTSQLEARKRSKNVDMEVEMDDYQDTEALPSGSDTDLEETI